MTATPTFDELLAEATATGEARVAAGTTTLSHGARS